MDSTPTQLLVEIKAVTGLAEEAIGKRLGCSQATINRILHGKCDCKSSTLMAILKWHAEVAQAAAA